MGLIVCGEATCRLVQ